MYKSVMRYSLTKTVLAALALVISSVGHAADVVQLPGVNLGNYVFLDGMGGPGTLVQVYGNHFNGASITDAKGDNLPGQNKVDVNAMIGQYTYISHHKFLGGYFGAETLFSVADIDPDTSLAGLPNRGESGLGDLSFSPILIQWTDGSLFGKSFFSRLSTTINLPVGSYDADNDVNVGSNAYNFDPYYSGTLWLTPKLSSSFRLHYLWNGKNDDPNPLLNADDTQAGEAFHMNYAMSYQVTPELRLGIAGYYLKQTTQDRIDGVRQADSKEQVFAIGPGLLYQNSTGILRFNSYFESGAENRSEGVRLSVSYAWLFS